MSVKAEGVLEILSDGYGFLRGENYLSSKSDIFVSANRIKSMRLRTGDHQRPPHRGISEPEEL